LLLAVGAATLVALPASAATVDGSVPLLCVSSRAFDCSSGTGCIEASAEGVNMADMLEVDVKAKKMTALDADIRGRASPIAAVSHANGRLVISGVDGTRGWTLAIQEAGGHSVLTVSDTGMALILYGECTAK
jgi:Mrp family chromosome partitioning ATPase